MPTTAPPRLKKPEPLPQIDQAAAAEWYSGWWHALPVGIVIGLAAGVLLSQHIRGA
jgi:hypothetical protein